MKKFIFLILIMFLVPFYVEAASVSISIDCPSSAKASSEVKCTFSATPSGSNLSGVQGNYSIKNGTYKSFSLGSGWTAYQNTSTGFSLGITGNPFTSKTTFGTLVFKMPSSGSATITLTNIAGTDSSYNTLSGSVNTKTVTVQSTNNNLKSLSLNNGTLSPSFSAGTTSYTATVNASSTTISAATAEAKAKVSGTGSKTLKYGKNTFKVVVTSEAGTTKTYTIVITRPDNRSTNNNLKSLSTSVGSISFNKSNTTYNLDVAADVTSVKINATVEDSKASFVSGYGARTVNLKYGKNAVLVKVKAENEKVKTYTININREDNRSTNNNLISLSLSAGAMSFDKNTLNYNVSVPYETTRVEINAMVEDSKSTMVINNTDLVVGDNIVTIVVTSESGATKTYTLNIKRLTEAEKMSDNNNVSSIDIFGHDFNLVEGVFEYDINVASNEKDLLFNILMEDDRANYIIEGNESIKDGSVITVKAISESGIETEYKFNINKEAIKSEKSDFGIYIIACLFCLLIGYGMGFVTPMVINKLKPATVNNSSAKNLSKEPVKKVVKKVKVVKKNEE